MANRILNKPIRIGKMELKNRMAFPPMNTNFTNENGAVTELMMEYYSKRAKGGASLVTVEAATIDQFSRNHGAQPRLHESALIGGWSRLVDRVHRYGAKISIELVHYGSECTVNDDNFVSASNVTSISPYREVHEMTLEEIRIMQQSYVDAIVMAKKAGFDAITYHAAHGNIMPQFFSEMFNKRTDWYGGSLTNRARFAREIVEMSREAVGPGFPLIMRISGEEYYTAGRKIDETVEICKIMEQAGIDAFDISGGIGTSYLFSISPGNFPGITGFMMPNAKAIKNAVSVPVIAAGGVRDPEYAEELLQGGFADVISIGRSFIADPDFGLKALYGKEQDIRPCISCNNCLMEIDQDRILTCTVNAQAGREDYFCGIAKAETKKKILVVGAGAAGLEAARVSALRGHDVTIVEKADKVGGAMYTAGLPPHKERILYYTEWCERQLEKLGVTIHLNTAYDKSMQEQYDHVFICAGSNYMRVIPGSDGENVLIATDALENPEKVGDKVVVIGGGSCGFEVAEFFGGREIEVSLKEYADFDRELVIETQKSKKYKNKDVSVIEMMCETCCDMEAFTREVITKVLDVNGVDVLLNSKVLDIQPHSVRVIDMKKGNLLELPADTVILSAGLIPNRVDEASEKVTYLGDSEQPGKIVQAVFRAYSAASDI